MLALLWVALGVAVAGHALSESLWRWQARRSGAGGIGDVVGPFERATSSALCVVVVLLAISWGLAVGHLLYSSTLIAGATAAGAAGGLSIWRTRSLTSPATITLPRSVLVGVAVASPIAIWIVYVLWRSSEIPVLSHDALLYHMPKAVMLTRAHGYGYFLAPNSRIPTFPFDYELTMADIILLTGSDRLTEWPSTYFYALFLLGSGALAERWWGRGLHVLGVVLVVAAMPVALLHSGAQKNDLMSAAFAVAGTMWLARAVRGDAIVPWILSITATAAYLGTKFQGVGASLVFAFCAVVFGWSRRRELASVRRSDGIVVAGVAVAAFVLLGGVAYVGNLVHTGWPTGINTEHVQVAGYPDFRALAYFTYMALAVPFSKHMTAVYVPWTGHYWWWPSHDLMFSHCGVVVSVLALALPVGVLRYRKALIPEAAREPRVVGTMFVLMAVGILLLGLRPFGMFNSSLRWVIFLAPAIASWTVAPLLRELATRGGLAKKGSYALLVALAAGFVSYAVKYATNDVYVPMSYLKFALEHPGSRSVPIEQYRAESVIDMWALPDDTIAIDGDFGPYVYQAYGQDLTRTIVYVPAGDGPAVIPDQAQWVVVDRVWAKRWNHPDWHDLSTLAYLDKGTPMPEDLRVFRQLKNDPHWVLVYRNRENNQAIFLRAGVERPVVPSVFDDRAPH